MSEYAGSASTAALVGTPLAPLPRRHGWRQRAGAIGATAGVETKRFFHDRIALFTTLLMPALMAMLIGVSNGSAPEVFAVVVVDEDGSPVAEEVIGELSASPALEVVVVTDPDQAERDVRMGLKNASVVIPAGFGDTEPGQTAEVRLVVDQTSNAAGPVTAAISSVLARLSQESIAVSVAETALVESETPPGTTDPLPSIAEQVIGEISPVEVEVTAVGSTRPADENAFAYAIPSQMTLFIFLNGLFTGAVLVDARRLGVTRRMMSAPVGFGTHLAGLGSARVFLGLLQAAIMFFVGASWFGVDFGDPVAAGVVTVLWTVVAAAAGMLLGSIVNTDAQNTAVAVPVGIVFAMLGGCMWPLEVTPPLMQAIGHLTPHAWAMDAWTEIIYDGGGLSDITVDVAALSGFAIVLSILAVVMLRRRLTH